MQPFGTFANRQLRPFINSVLNSHGQSAKRHRNHKLSFTNHYGTVVQDNELLEARVNELERNNEYKDHYIKELEASNSELRNEIAQLKAVNKNMMKMICKTGENGEQVLRSGDFDTMCINNMQVELEKLIRENAEFVSQLQTIQNENESMKKYLHKGKPSGVKEKRKQVNDRLEETRKISMLGDDLTTPKSNSGILL
jgi:chromosome segregation ATPase